MIGPVRPILLAIPGSGAAADVRVRIGPGIVQVQGKHPRPRPIVPIAPTDRQTLMHNQKPFRSAT